MSACDNCLLCIRHLEIFVDSGGHRDFLLGSIRLSVCIGFCMVLSLPVDRVEGEMNYESDQTGSEVLS